MKIGAKFKILLMTMVFKKIIKFLKKTSSLHLYLRESSKHISLWKSHQKRTTYENLKLLCLNQLQRIIATRIWLIPLLDQLQQIIATKIWLIPLSDQLQQIVATKIWLIPLVDVRQHLQNWGEKRKKKVSFTIHLQVILYIHQFNHALDCWALTPQGQRLLHWIQLLKVLPQYLGHFNTCPSNNFEI
jgi:hypothetical protein